MDVKDAVKIAKDYVADVFADERIQNLGLEEVEYEERDAAWRITIGFKRAFSKPVERKEGGVLQNFYPYDIHNRWYKVVTIRESDGKVISVRDRELDYAA